MAELTTGLVDIVRDFFSADEALRRLVDHYRAGSLTWEEVRTLIRDDEESPLYRLKERSHALFRSERPGLRLEQQRDVLFDLAIGSLFHEAMKFRENFYQREVYGPRVRGLRVEAGAESEALFEEFERILHAGSVRLEEGVAETEALLDRSREQLVDLVTQHSQDGHVARYWIEQSERAERVFGRDADALIAEIYGSAAAGWALAGRSYVGSGYFREAAAVLRGAIERGASAADLEPLIAYANGMAAYFRGEYADSIERLWEWSEAPDGGDPSLAQQACAAMSRIEHLVEGANRAAQVRQAAALVERLSAR